MQKLFIILVLSTCACFTRAQVWTNYINSIPPMLSAPDIYCTVEDTITNTLYVGGQFNTINQYSTNAIIKFDGITFDTLQCGMDGDWPGNWITTIRNMVMYKSKLYVFGNFTRAGYRYSPKMAAWNGTTWDSIKVKGSPEFAYMLNNDMYIWGVDSIEGKDINGMARFDGVNWFDAPVPHTTGHTASYIVPFQGKLYKSGQVTPASSDANLSYSDGSDWIPWVGILGNNNKAVFGMKVIDTMLFVYGRFYSIAGTQCAGLAGYNGKNWYGFGQGISTNQGWETVQNIQKINEELFITGVFDKIEGIGNSDFSKPQTTNLAKFDGEKWCITESPINNEVMGVVKYKGDLYTYGAFEKIGNDSIRSFGKYNGEFNSACSPNVVIKMSITGLDEMINFKNFRIYPNPVKEKLNIEFDSFENSDLKVELINSLGMTLINLNAINQKQEVDLSFLASGIYFLKLYNNSEQKVFKVVKD